MKGIHKLGGTFTAEMIDVNSQSSTEELKGLRHEGSLATLHGSDRDLFPNLAPRNEKQITIEKVLVEQPSVATLDGGVQTDVGELDS